MAATYSEDHPTKLQSTINRALTIGLGLTLVILAANFVRNWLPETQAISEAPRSPYTVTLKETARDRSGKTTGEQLYTLAQTSNGTFVLRFEGPLDQKDTRTFRNLYLPSGLEVRMNEVVERKSTRRIPAHVLRNPANQCTFADFKERLQGVENVAGYRAARVIQPDVTEPTRTSWYSLDHGCALVSARYEWADGAVSEKSLVSLVVGEPTVPKHYAETAPSGLVPDGGPHSPAMHTALGRLDEDYYKHRP